MTKEEVMSLIDKKIIETENMHDFEEFSSWYSGIIRGLETARQIVGMLYKPNNRVS